MTSQAIYDFLSEENEQKWRGMLSPALRKVSTSSVHLLFSLIVVMLTMIFFTIFSSSLYLVILVYVIINYILCKY